MHIRFTLRVCSSEVLGATELKMTCKLDNDLRALGLSSVPRNVYRGIERALTNERLVSRSSDFYRNTLYMVLRTGCGAPHEDAMQGGAGRSVCVPGTTAASGAAAAVDTIRGDRAISYSQNGTDSDERPQSRIHLPELGVDRIGLV